MLEGILFYCIICIHHFYLGFDDSTLSQLRENACNQCARSLFVESQISRSLNPFSPDEIFPEHQPTFDPHLLPVFQKTIEEKIQTACDTIEPYNGEIPLSGALDFKGQMLLGMFRDLSNVLREVYQYEKDIKEALEKEKSSILKEIEQKVNDVKAVSKELKNIVEITERTEMGIDLAKASRNTEAAAALIYSKQRAIERQVTKLVFEEMTKTLNEYSKMISVIYNHYTLMEQIKPPELFNQATEFDELVKTLKGKIGSRTIPNFSVPFEKILFEFNITLEEISKETDMFVGNIYYDAGRIQERVNQRLNENNIHEVEI